MPGAGFRRSSACSLGQKVRHRKCPGCRPSLTSVMLPSMFSMRSRTLTLLALIRSSNRTARATRDRDTPATDEPRPRSEAWSGCQLRRDADRVNPLAARVPGQQSSPPVPSQNLRSQKSVPSRWSKTENAIAAPEASAATRDGGSALPLALGSGGKACRLCSCRRNTRDQNSLLVLRCRMVHEFKRRANAPFIKLSAAGNLRANGSASRATSQIDRSRHRASHRAAALPRRN